MKILSKFKNWVYESFVGIFDTGLFEPVDIEIRIVPSSRKHHDTTVFNKYHYDEIMKAHAEYVKCKGMFDGERKTLTDVTWYLNTHLGLDKSRSAYARVWNNHIDRATLETPNEAS